MESYYAAPREILLFFYYPSDEFMGYLMTVDELEFYDEIECEDLFGGKDSRERIMIFSLPDYEMEEWPVVNYGLKDKVAIISGLRDYIIVDTEDVLMICPRSEEQNLKKYIDDIKFNQGDKFS